MRKTENQVKQEPYRRSIEFANGPAKGNRGTFYIFQVEKWYEDDEEDIHKYGEAPVLIKKGQEPELREVINLAQKVTEDRLLDDQITDAMEQIMEFVQRNRSNSRLNSHNNHTGW